MELTQSYLRECFDYGPLTGDLVWRARPRDHFKNPRIWKMINTRDAGKIVATRTDGYLSVKICGKQYRCHRIIWFWMTGAWPKDQIDHEDHDRANNKWKNLREASDSKNRRNQTLRTSNTSGFNGVYWSKPSSNWYAQIKLNGKLKHLGCFSEIGDAIAARVAANIKYDFHPNHGAACL